MAPSEGGDGESKKKKKVGPPLIPNARKARVYNGSVSALQKKAKHKANTGVDRRQEAAVLPVVRFAAFTA